MPVERPANHAAGRSATAPSGLRSTKSRSAPRAAGVRCTGRVHRRPRRGVSGAGSRQPTHCPMCTRRASRVRAARRRPDLPGRSHPDNVQVRVAEVAVEQGNSGAMVSMPVTMFGALGTILGTVPPDSAAAAQLRVAQSGVVARSARTARLPRLKRRLSVVPGRQRLVVLVAEIHPSRVVHEAVQIGLGGRPITVRLAAGIALFSCAPAPTARQGRVRREVVGFTAAATPSLSRRSSG
jgi:hypothetical protein